MALAGAVSVKDITRRRKKIRILVTPSGNYVAGGDALDLTALTNPKFLPGAFPGGLPDDFEVLNAPAGYTGELIAGSALNNWKLKISTSAGNELAAGAYPAALLADPFEIELSGPIGQF